MSAAVGLLQSIQSGSVQRAHTPATASSNLYCRKIYRFGCGGRKCGNVMARCLSTGAPGTFLYSFLQEPMYML